MATPRRITPYDDRIPPDLWIEFPRADLRRRLIEAVRAIARLRGATSLDVQEALRAAWNVPPVGSVFSRLAQDLARLDSRLPRRYNAATRYDNKEICDGYYLLR